MFYVQTSIQQEFEDTMAERETELLSAREDLEAAHREKEKLADNIKVLEEEKEKLMEQQKVSRLIFVFSNFSHFTSFY